MKGTVKRKLSSLDGAYTSAVEVMEPDRYRDLLSLDDRTKLSVRGAGLSYAALSFGGTARVIGMTRFNRLLDFDAARGTVTAEGGISLGELYDFLAPRGFILAAQPGHPNLTLGGCIAANVHGKNQVREGLFGDWVEEVRLFHPLHGELRSSGGRGSLNACRWASVWRSPVRWHPISSSISISATLGASVSTCFRYRCSSWRSSSTGFPLDVETVENRPR